MQVNFRIIHLKKRFPLTISRGVYTGSDNLFVAIKHEGITGLGEVSPGKSEGAATAEAARESLQDFVMEIKDPTQIRTLYAQGRAANIPACAYAALDMALWDWLAKKAKMPLYRLLGMPLPKIPTSLTIGINPPEVIRERIPLLLEGTGVKALKIKLGAKEGVEADKAMYAQVVDSCKKFKVQLRVDANGGWSVDEAIMMMQWLADRGTDYIEQPLAEGQEKDLPFIFRNRPLPIFVDESCRFASDIPNWAHAVDGVNIKLMKCGGITGALDILSTAKAHNLKTMIGCMGESSVSIAAGAALSGLLDHIDLDAHLNLNPDPCEGAPMINGVIVPRNLPGHGAVIKEDTKNAR